MVGSGHEKECKLSRVEKPAISPEETHVLPHTEPLGPQITNTHVELIQYPAGSYATVTLEVNVTSWDDGAQTRRGRTGSVPVCYHRASHGGMDFGHLYCTHIATLSGGKHTGGRIVGDWSANRPAPEPIPDWATGSPSWERDHEDAWYRGTQDDKQLWGDK